MEQTFEEYLKSFLFLQLDRAEGLDSYGCDLGTELYRLGESRMPDDDKWNYIFLTKDFPEDAGEYLDYEKENFGAIISNPFLRPTEMLRSMLNEACDGIMKKVPYVHEFWDDEVKLTSKDIEKIKVELNEVEWGGFESC